MGFWLDMVFGKSPLQSEVDNVHGEVARLDRAMIAQVRLNESVHEALEAVDECQKVNSAFAVSTAEEIVKLKARVDLLEANVTVHKRPKGYK